MYQVAPKKSIRVRPSAKLYLSKETLQLMRARDEATTPASYRRLRNRVCSLVRRDKLRSNLLSLKKAKRDPKALWALANRALGKSGGTELPPHLVVNGVETRGRREAAEAMGAYLAHRVDHLRQGLGPTCPGMAVGGLPVSMPVPMPVPRFQFSFTNAGKVAKIIKSLKPTDALGVDGIPVSVLKLGAEVLASPIAHLVNQSLASGRVPVGFKTGVVIPVHKGKGKCSSDPASYRPISILPALSKVLELIVKADLDNHLANIDGLPTSQYGFRRDRSTSMAIATAHAHWTCGVQEGKAVGITSFDFTAAFDTIDPETLLSKLESLGVTGNAKSWFASYLTGGCQCVDWSGSRSGLSQVKYGVRQGSILGPLLFLVLVADLPSSLGVNEREVCCYADDVCIWAVADNAAEVQHRLNKRAAALTEYAARNGLVLNPLRHRRCWPGE